MCRNEKSYEVVKILAFIGFFLLFLLFATHTKTCYPIYITSDTNHLLYENQNDNHTSEKQNSLRGFPGDQFAADVSTFPRQNKEKAEYSDHALFIFGLLALILLQFYNRMIRLYQDKDPFIPFIFLKRILWFIQCMDGKKRNIVSLQF